MLKAAPRVQSEGSKMAVLGKSTPNLQKGSGFPVQRPAHAGDIDPQLTSSQVFPHWPLGLAAACIASLLFVIAMQFVHRGLKPAPMANSRSASPSKSKTLRADSYKNRCWPPGWKCGVLILALSWLSQAVALTLASLSMVQPLASLSIIMNALAVMCCFSEERQVLRQSYLITLKGISLTLIGTVLVVLVAQKHNTAYAAEELESMFLQVDFVLFEIFCAILGMAVFWLARNAKSRYHGSRSPFMLFYAFTAGWAGAQQYMLMKAIGEMIKASIHGRPGAASFSFTPIILLAACTAMSILQIALISFGLKRFQNETVRFIGSYQGFTVLIGSAAGGFYFNEFNDFSANEWAGFSLGMVLILWGVMVVTALRGASADEHLQRSRMRSSGKAGCCNGMCYCYHLCGPCCALVDAEDFEAKIIENQPDDYFDPVEHAHFAQLWADPEIW